MVRPAPLNHATPSSPSLTKADTETMTPAAKETP